jgi:hypothetical protein
VPLHENKSKLIISRIIKNFRQDLLVRGTALKRRYAMPMYMGYETVAMKPCLLYAKSIGTTHSNQAK